MIKLGVLAITTLLLILFLYYIYNEGKVKGEAQEVEKTTKQTINLQNEIIKTKKRQQDIVNIQNDNVESRIKWLHLIYEKGGYSSTSE